MRGKASIPFRIGRMEQQRGNWQPEETITILAEEYGLDPNEVRYELAAIEPRIRQDGPEPPEVGLRRLAAEFGLDIEEIRAEVAQIHGRLASRGVVL